MGSFSAAPIPKKVPSKRLFWISCHHYLVSGFVTLGVSAKFYLISFGAI